MEQDRHATSVNRSERTVVNDPERTAVVPRFDEGSIRRAQPAVPLGRRPRLLRRPSPLVLMVALAAVVGIVAGFFGSSIYMSRRAAQRAAETPRRADGAAAGDASAQAAPSPSASAEELFTPAEGDLPDVSPPEAKQAADDGAGEVAGRGEQAALREALAEWISATNARDISRQMSFYSPRLDAYYLSRNAPAAAVRAEKARVFGHADSIDVQASPAAIRFHPDGSTATMRFRKRYQIAGRGVDRRGEVVQELRWRKTDKGWKIVSERDVRVLNRKG